MHRKTRTSWLWTFVGYRAKACSHSHPSEPYRRAFGVIYVCLHEHMHDEGQVSEAALVVGPGVADWHMH